MGSHSSSARQTDKHVAQQLAFVRALDPTLFLPEETLAPLIREDAISPPSSTAGRRGNALASVPHRGGGVALFHPHGPLCDRVRMCVHAPAAAEGSHTALHAATAPCDGSVRQISACDASGRGGIGDAAPAAVTVAARTDFAVQVWRLDATKEEPAMRSVARRIFERSVIDATLGDGQAAAVTSDGRVHCTSLGEGGRGERESSWLTVESAVAELQNDWRFVTRGMQQGTFLVAGMRAFGVCDCRTRAIGAISEINAGGEASHTTALYHHPDHDKASLFGRVTASTVELYDQRSMARPIARWEHYQKGLGQLDMLHFALHGPAEQRQPYLLGASSVSGRVFAYPYTERASEDGAATALLQPPQRMPDLRPLLATPAMSAPSHEPRGYLIPPRGKLRGIGSSRSLECLYELDDCGEIYAVPLQELPADTAGAGAAPGSARDQGSHTTVATAPARPAVWVQSVDTRPIVDSRALVRALAEGIGAAGPADVAPRTSLGLLAHLHALRPEGSVQPADGEGDEVESSAALPHPEQLRLPRTTLLAESRKRSRSPAPGERGGQPSAAGATALVASAGKKAVKRPELWRCAVCDEQFSAAVWATLRSGPVPAAAGGASGSKESQGTDGGASPRLCDDCATAVETAMREKLEANAKADSSRRKAKKKRDNKKPAATERCLATLAQTLSAAQPALAATAPELRALRQETLAYIRDCPRTLHELTTWLQQRHNLAVAEEAVGRFVEAELAEVKREVMQSRLPSGADEASPHESLLTVLSVRPTPRSPAPRGAAQAAGPNATTLHKLRQDWARGTAANED